MSTENDVIFYDLEKVRFIVKDACDLEIIYAFEDLVFSEHGLFIIRFPEKGDQPLECWFNKECLEQNRVNIFNSLAKSGNLNGTDIAYKGKFEMKQKENKEEFDITFESI